MWLKLVLDHLKGNPLEYLLLLIVAVGIGWKGSSIADIYVHDRIIGAVDQQMIPVNAKMNGLQSDVSSIKGGLDDLIESGIKRDIIEIKTLLCYSPGEPRLVRQYEDLQERFEAKSGHRYDPPGCDVLRKQG